MKRLTMALDKAIKHRKEKRMPHKQAIRWIERFQDNIIRKFDFDDKRFSDALKATQIAKEALEKQIPQKPLHTYKRLGLVVEGCCPVCEESVLPEQVFCRHCGQAIDWNEVKE